MCSKQFKETDELLALQLSTVSEVGITKYLETNRGKKLRLCDPATDQEKYIWKVGPLEDTIYKGNRNVLQQWEDCYLPDHVGMQVLGEVHHTSWDSDDPGLVLMMGNDEVYAYIDEDLHLVAESLKNLCTEGIHFPSETVYYYWECFKDMQKEELDKLSESEEVKKVKDKYKEEVEEWAREVMKLFKEGQISRGRRCNEGAAIVKTPLINIS